MYVLFVTYVLACLVVTFLPHVCARQRCVVRVWCGGVALPALNRVYTTYIFRRIRIIVAYELCRKLAHAHLYVYVYVGRINTPYIFRRVYVYVNTSYTAFVYIRLRNTGVKIPYAQPWYELCVFAFISCYQSAAASVAANLVDHGDGL